jgi:hypothetical protein
MTAREDAPILVDERDFPRESALPRDARTHRHRHGCVVAASAPAGGIVQLRQDPLPTHELELDPVRLAFRAEFLERATKARVAAQMLPGRELVVVRHCLQIERADADIGQ